jgi:predicted alpha-1,2-mannosidase
MKGIRNYDVEKAYQYAKNSSAMFGNDKSGFTPGGLSISHTLEYAYTDWCISELARALGKEDDAKEFAEKGQAYRNVFDADKGWFRPREADGSWTPWKEGAKTEEWYGAIEATPYQQGWFVPHDIDGLVGLLGGRENALKELENFFDMAPADFSWNAYYNHANEPVHLVPFMFNRLGAPWLTQKWTRIICRDAYSNKVEGLVGNEDVGQMSAWYVLAASGIHPACPGETSFEITSPVFDEVTFRLDGRYAQAGTFRIIAHDNSPENVYISKAVLNGKEIDTFSIDYSDITSGSVLELWMSDKPNKQ